MDVTAPAPNPVAPTVDVFGTTLEERVLLAARDCIGAKGLRDTTVDDIAVAAGCGRASIYRLFPGGRRGLLLAMVHAEVEALLEGLADTVDAAADLPTAVAEAVHAAASALAVHPVLQRSLVEDPGSVLPYISFDGAAPLYARVAAWGRDHLARFVGPDDAEAVGEWAARIVLGHLHQPSTRFDLTDPACVRHLVDAYLVPGVRAGALA
ncbi:TetR/AcrR family transcriptional regulator [Rhabdothermincola salaria]|uniref:TetR/AcrR family transcriptional regulator n=1 Tax=Rhabdothermincola salaria TaxID=2903142 RepID=UPI001E5BADA6|nr:TetR/AcrR family transcriptional regulator [Rhabdothermincola salaria]MCD9624901.1 TetR/AcrR family transcriptional regulator [Rhabdothermincola salaria]